MVGYSSNGYRLWDAISRKIVIARNVKFDESKFGSDDTECQQLDAEPQIISVERMDSES